MMPGVSFLLGLASGLVLLPLMSYRHVSPGWLRAGLWAGGLLLLSRYLLIYGSAAANAALAFSETAGFLLPAVVALDQLIRHPGMTPKKLVITWCLPLLAVAGGICWWPAASALAVDLCGAALCAACLFLMTKIPLPALHRALFILSLSYGFWVVERVTARLHGSSLPFALSELTLLIGLWYAYETAHSLQQG